jgi:peptidyl-prolyl cis-trans isomerase D
MTEVSYEVKFIKQAKISKEYDDSAINEYYNENKADLKDGEGKILPIEAAKDKIKEELNAKETKKEALKAYIAYKKGELKDVEINNSTISLSNNSFGAEALESVSKLTSASPFSKPVMVGGDFITFELVKTNPSTPKSYEDAKGEVISVYVPEQKKAKLLELAKSSFNTFHSSSTDFITGNDSNKLTDLSTQEADEFLAALFTTQDRRGFVSLENGNVVMYNILEQKMLSNSNVNRDNPIVKLKSAMFNESLVKNLQNKYKTEIFIQGL